MVGDGGDAHTVFESAINQRIRKAAQRENAAAAEGGSAETGVAGNEPGTAEHLSEKGICQRDAGVFCVVSRCFPRFGLSLFGE